MVTSKDFKDTNSTLDHIAHIKEGIPLRVSVDKLLSILEFILTEAKSLMFKKDGTPKSKLELTLSLFQIIGFVKNVIRMINGDVKPISRVRGVSDEAKVVEAVEKAVKKAKKPIK